MVPDIAERWFITLNIQQLLFQKSTQSKGTKQLITSQLDAAISTLHLEWLWGLLFTLFHFMVYPSSHAPTHTAESDVGNQVDEPHNGIVSIKINANIETRSTHRQNLQAIVAPNNPDIILIQTETILPHNHALRSTNCHTREAASLDTHATLWTTLFT